MSINTNVETLLKYAFEKERSIARNMTTNDFYIQTKLDKENLRKDILDGKFHLVLLMGTPGCGKSEFIHSLKLAIYQKKLDDDFQIIHDATHVEEEKASAVVKLKRTLTSFEDNNIGGYLKSLKNTSVKGHSLKDLKKAMKTDPPPPIKKMFVVGVNRGILNRLFADNSFKRLKTYCENFHEIGSKKFILIDLSKRDYTAPDNNEEQSLLTKLISKITSENNWEKSECSGCEIEDFCPLLFNAKYLRKRSYSNPLLFHLQLLHLRKQCVLTFRDLLGILSYSIAGHKKYYGKKSACEAIKDMVDEERWQRLASLFIWNTSTTDINLFQGLDRELQGSSFKKAHTFGRAPDRFFGKRGLLSQFDPKDLNTPSFDKYAKKVYTDPEESVNEMKSNLHIIEQKLFSRLFSDLQYLNQRPDDIKSKQEKAEQTQKVYEILTYYLKRRKFYDEYLLLPENDKSEYIGIEKFKAFITKDTSSSTLEEIIKESLVMSDRIEYERESPRLALSRGLRESEVFLKLLYDKFDIKIEVEKFGKGTVKYVETGLSCNMKVIFEMCNNQLTEEFTLDMFEALYRIKSGYDPAYVGRFNVAFIAAIKNSLIMKIEYYKNLAIVIKTRNSDEKIELVYDDETRKFKSKD